MALQDQVPAYDPIEDAAQAAGFATLSMIPVVGGPVVEIASGVIASRQQRRQYEFNLQLAQAVDTVIAANDGMTVERIVESDEFMAAYERASRFAAESESLEHRRRLAFAAAQMGDWSPVNKVMRKQMLSWVAEMDDAHVRALKFLDDPRAFVAKVDPDPSRIPPDFTPSVNLSNLIGEWIFDYQPGWNELTRIVVRYLTTAELAAIPPQGMSVNGAFSCHTTELGRSLLHFIEFPSS